MRAIAALVTLAAAGVLAVVALAAPPGPQQPTEVLKWNRIAMSTLLVAPVGTMPGRRAVRRRPPRSTWE